MVALDANGGDGAELPECLGCGFVLSLHGKEVFVTTAHALQASSGPSERRYGIVANGGDGLLESVRGVGEFRCLDNKESPARVPDTQDVAVALLLTKAHPEETIAEGCFAKPRKNRTCLVSGIASDGENATFAGLVYKDDHEGLHRFSFPQAIDAERWAGLSGAPCFDDKGRLVGMLVRAVAEQGTVLVMPVERILELAEELV